MEWVALILLSLALVCGLGVAAYFILRRLFDRATDRVADRIGSVLGDLGAKAAGTRAGRSAASRMRAITGGYTHFGAYAAAHGMSEDQARMEFADSIERIARIMDGAVRLPIIGPVGLDAVLGLFPVAGDLLSSAIAVSLIGRSLKYGVPHDLIARMLGNVLLDFILGAVPVAGDVADMWFRANMRNVALLREYLEREARDTFDTSATRVS
jgi:hypothetical protein